MRIGWFFAVVSTFGIVACAPDVVEEAQLGDECSLRYAYSVKKTDDGFIRCEIVPGTSLHADDAQDEARFVWTTTTEDQYLLASVASGIVRIDGSSTVAPLSAVTAKFFESSSKSVRGKQSVRVSVGISGTGGGFEKFCNGETDISNASRAIKDSEVEACLANGIEFTEVQVANDGLAVVVNQENTWAQCLTLDELRRMWEPGSTLSNWSQVRPGFPDVRLKLFGAGTDSGTFDAFTTFINGKSGVARRVGVATSENDNVTVQGVLSESGALGYFGYSYAVENANKVRMVAIDGGEGCVEPTKESVQNYSYPLSRPLFMYVKNASLRDLPAVGAFVQFFVDNSEQINTDALFVPMTEEVRLELKDRIAQLVRIPTNN
jgi:phosphate transport system substrate-binding protein